MSVFNELSEIKDREIMRNDLAFAFLTNIPITRGHTLICPIREVLKYEDCTEREKGAIEDLRLKMTKILHKKYNTIGFNFAWNDGAEAGQSVPHFHFHIVPRTKGDTGVYEYDPRKFLYRPGSRENVSEEVLKSIALEIKEII